MKWRFELTTLRSVRVLNDLAKNGVEVSRVERSDKALRFVVDGKDKPRALAAIRDMDIPFKVWSTDWQGICYRGIKRPLLPLLALAAVVAILLCNVVWRVEVSGVDGEVLAKAERIVADYRMHWKGNVDQDELAARLVAIDGVAQASVVLDGVKLKVELLSSLPQGDLIEDDYAPIVAKCDCVITSVVVERGRAMVKVGDTVKAGAVLIAPEYLVDIEHDVTVPCPALGTVTGTVFYTASCDWHRTQTRIVETRQSYCSAVIIVGDKKFGEVDPSPFPLFREEVERILLGSVVPIVVERHVYYELVEVTETGDWAAQKEELCEILLSSLEDKIKKGVQLSRKWCIIRETDFGYAISAYAQVEEEVSSRPSQGEG